MHVKIRICKSQNDRKLKSQKKILKIKKTVKNKMVAPALRVRMPRRGVDRRQLQLYIKILLFYMTVVYFCVLHVRHAAMHVRKSEARLDARLASELRLANELRIANLTAQSEQSRLRPLQPARHEKLYAKT
jgi:hypothetical protein